MENVRGRSDIKLVTDEKKAKKLTAKPHFKNFTIYHDKLVSVEMNVTRIKFNKPIYIGQAILDISKTLAYDFHHHMKDRYQDKIELCYGDTDSGVYLIKTEDIYQDMKQEMHLYDTSDYPKDHILYSTNNKKVVGKMKDEHNGRIFTEFVGLRSKMYAMQVEDGEVTKRAKGTSKIVVKNTLTLDDYRNIVLNKTRITRVQNRIMSKRHNLSTVKQNKLALSWEDDKRVILEDGINTLPYGHYLLV